MLKLYLVLYDYLYSLPVLSKNVDTNYSFIECWIGTFYKIVVNVLL